MASFCVTIKTVLIHNAFGFVRTKNKVARENNRILGFCNGIWNFTIENWLKFNEFRVKYIYWFDK